MKNITELALGTADVSAITAKAIASSIEEVARGQCKIGQLFKVNTDLMADGTPQQIQFPKKGTGIAVSWGVSPNNSIASSSFAYDSFTITTSKAGLRLEFTNEALKQALRDVIKDHIYEGGLVYAETIDDVATSIMLDLKSQTATITATSVGAFTNYPVFKLVSSTGGTISSIEYDTGSIILNGSIAVSTITSLYANNPKGTTLWVGATSPGSLTVKDISRVKAKMATQHRFPDVLLFNDADYASLIFDSNVKFVDVSAYGKDETILNGEIGKIIGLKCITSTRIPQGNAILVASQRLGYDVHRRDFEGVREDRPEFDAVWYHFWGERNFGVADTLAVGLVCNAQSTDFLYKAS
jgi:hypothetical protein